LCWADWNRSLNITQSNDLNGWAGAIATLPETSTGSPSLGYVGQQHLILVVWTGTDSGHHLNVAILPV